MMTRPVVRKLVAFLGGTSAFSTTTRSGRPGHYSNYHYHPPPPPTYPSATMAALPLLLSRPIDRRFANNDSGVCRGGRRSSSFSAAAGDGESVGTHPTASMTEAELIKLMVGREVSHIYPAADGTPGDVVLSWLPSHFSEQVC